jgi:hypothetical protein
MLLKAGVKVKASYSREEVCRVLGVSPRTFWSMVCAYEPGADGKPAHPFTLDSFTLRGHRRVPHHELADFLRRNRTFDRIHACSQEQPPLPFPE